MNKKELVTVISKKCGLSRKTANDVMQTILDETTNALIEGDKVHISGFGTFSTKLRNSKIFYNPKTEKKTEIPSSTALVFKPGKVIRGTLNR